MGGHHDAINLDGWQLGVGVGQKGLWLWQHIQAQGDRSVWLQGRLASLRDSPVVLSQLRRGLGQVKELTLLFASPASYNPGSPWGTVPSPVLVPKI